MKWPVLLAALFFTTPVFSLELKLATLNWAPFYAENLPEQGFFTAICREAYRRAGYDIKVVFVPWARAVRNAKLGIYDGLLGAYSNVERKKHFVFSDFVATNDEVFIKKTGNKLQFDSLEDLKHLRIGGLRESAQVLELKSLGIDVQEVTDTYQTILTVEAGRIDLGVMGKQFFHHYLTHVDKRFENRVEVTGKPFRSYKLFTVISRQRIDADLIINKFNDALNKMKLDGSYQAILMKFGQQYK